MNVKKLTRRVKQLTEWCGEFHREVFTLDGKEVLHFCQTFYPDSNPYYSRVNRCGEYRPQITKEEFSTELKRILDLT